MTREHFKLCLYVAGDNRKSQTAIENLKKYCSEHLEGEYTIEVVDLLKHPHLAEGEQIIATPTLVKKLPSPVRILVGDLSREDQFLVGLNLVRLTDSSGH
jgi:circadian clock protein KaiB